MRIQRPKPWTGALFGLIILIVGASMVLAAPGNGHHRHALVVAGKHHHHSEKKTGSSSEEDDGRTTRNYDYDITTANGRNSYGNTAGYSTFGTQEPSGYNVATSMRFNGPTAAQWHSPITSWFRSTSPDLRSRLDMRGSAPYMGTAGYQQASTPGTYNYQISANVRSPYSQSIQNAYRDPIYSGGTQSSNLLGTNPMQSPFANGNFFRSQSFDSTGFPSVTRPGVYQSTPFNFQYSSMGTPARVSTNIFQKRPTIDYKTEAPISPGVFGSPPFDSQSSINDHSGAYITAEDSAEGSSSDVIQTAPPIIHASPTHPFSTHNGKSTHKGTTIETPTSHNPHSNGQHGKLKSATDHHAAPELVAQTAGTTSPIASYSSIDKLRACSKCDETQVSLINGKRGNAKFFCLNDNFNVTCDAKGRTLIGKLPDNSQSIVKHGTP